MERIADTAVGHIVAFDHTALVAVHTAVAVEQTPACTGFVASTVVAVVRPMEAALDRWWSSEASAGALLVDRTGCTSVQPLELAGRIDCTPFAVQLVASDQYHATDQLRSE